MFNFHKPRVYRSTDGCCICRAKSSSSRFTASRKYEKESMQCFNLHEPRNGEICNACVLLVKRYKRLPVGSKRHWGHVVDARAGPGTKSLAKQKKRDNAEAAAAAAAAEVKSVNSSFLPEKFAKIFKKKSKGKITAAAAAAPVTSAINRPSSTSPTSEHNPSDSNESYDDDMQLTRGGGEGGSYQTRKRTAAAALAMDVVKRPKLTGSKRRRQLPPKKDRRAVDNVPFFEENDLVRLEVCCGVVFQSLSLGSCCYIIDPELYKPCEKHQRLRQQQHQLQVQHQQEMQQEKEKEKLATNPPTQVQSQAAKMGPLKKHHLFFKRQSESFPQGDVVHRISPIPLSKTEANSSHHTTQKPQQHSNLSLILKPTVAASSSLPTAAGVVSVGAASPSFSSSSSNCSTSSSVATKFNDNSSDSGFDEHVLERKSVSPPTQDEWKLRGTAAGGMQLILASGLPITGQSQNLVLAGNEFTARIVQQRQQETAAAGTAPPLKINVVPGGGSQGNSNKLRAIFNSANNSSSIQHENGVTTILPASSLAASNQTAAMNAIAPSTVTITPSSVVGKKVTAVANPKFILLKPAKFVGQTVPPPPPEAKIV
ncbi:uncharacterized protein [Drosophila kikkawai]|uniref:Uncharacterized protein LOC108076052 isoform X1 n=1 Tax=Drosophila kikkawai TaxID=30033 RepID=A0A6P4IN23_DROKI|nr:uncharacterized protein LOC108076052 isoform X1 [Drosophila kikkawai]XP_017024221.1 uncharacterized protein LOC108076052 isoform X1 [Drosophila kikkawai]XP_017024222.1 uncharacterized protein LOC108076052 isoform X1 [Drosophila kikkawai]XP_017024223.1 uncharacterized protein LOC108076052 isoform X1 [Drosophila kikkawai]XP_017024224.1 uncharacterized protein LOC108076052 isoform X1 [Drosophila kikkawai]